MANAAIPKFYLDNVSILGKNDDDCNDDLFSRPYTQGEMAFPWVQTQGTLPIPTLRTISAVFLRRPNKIPAIGRNTVTARGGSIPKSDFRRQTGGCAAISGGSHESPGSFKGRR